MIILTDNRANIINTAQTNDGRVQYYPIANDRIIIGGRDARRGVYCDPKTGMATDEHVAPADWDQACELMTEVNAHNRAALDAQRDRANAKADELDARLAASMRGVRGGYNDPNTF